MTAVWCCVGRQSGLLLRAQFQRSGRASLSGSAAIFKPNLRIVFGSQSGTAESFANDLEFDATKFSAQIIDAADFGVKDVTEGSRGAAAPTTVTAFIFATYGEGEPTDNAKQFMSDLLSETVDASGCHYAVFGLGNQQCFKDRYNVAAIALDKRLQELGAKQLLPIGLGDASNNCFAAFSAWKDDFLRVAYETAAVQSHPHKTSSPDQSNVPGMPDISKKTIIPDIFNRAKSKESKKLAVPDVFGKTKGKNESTAHVPDMVTNPCATKNGTTISAASVQTQNHTALLSQRQLAMVPKDRSILLCKVSELRQMFLRVNEFNSALHISFDLQRCRPYNSPAALNGACTTYEEYTRNLMAGDHVGIFAPNSTHVVNKFAASANLGAFEMDTAYWADSTRTLREALTWQLQLTGPVPITAIKVLHRWAAENELSPTATSLKRLIDDYDSFTIRSGADVTALLDMIPCSPKRFPPLPLPALLKTLPPISPRLYSLTHDPCTHAHSARLLCRLLRYRDTRSLAANRIVDGLCSAYLCESLGLNDEVALFFRESNFHLPRDPSIPVIMICGGSGIAPFLSFLEERNRRAQEADANLGPAVLYYGCRNVHEYMLRDEILQHLDGVTLGEKSRSVLSKLVVAFSVEHSQHAWETYNFSDHKNEVVCPDQMNISDTVSADIPGLLDYMRDGAHVYVCGGQGNFGNAVRNVVNALAEQAHSAELEVESGAGSGGDSVHSGLRLLVRQQRYFEDLAD